MKTPEQIAHDTITANYEDPESQDVLEDLVNMRALSADDIRSLMSAAVKADRAQRGDTEGQREE